MRFRYFTTLEREGAFFRHHFLALPLSDKTQPRIVGPSLLYNISRCHPFHLFVRFGGIHIMKIGLLLFIVLIASDYSSPVATRNSIGCDAVQIPKALTVCIQRFSVIPRGGSSPRWSNSNNKNSSTSGGGGGNNSSSSNKKGPAFRRSPIRHDETPQSVLVIVESPGMPMNRITPKNTRGRVDTKVVIGWTAFSFVAVSLAVAYRSVWIPLLDKQRIQEGTLNFLRQLQPSDPSASRFQPLLLYASGMAIWELAGLSTIPVETAAGMVFGWEAALYSLLGKFTGAVVAFTMGRTLLAKHVTQMLQRNELFQLVNAAPPSHRGTGSGNSGMDNTHPHPPLLTAFLMKFSCFPEIVKNFGSSLLPVIAPWMFFLATLIHGGSFTLLWTWLGVDTAKQLEQAAAATATRTSGSLQGALLIAGIVGVIITPLVMAWWIRDLKRLQAERHGNPMAGVA